MCVEEIGDEGSDKLHNLLCKDIWTPEDVMDVHDICKNLAYLWYRQERFSSDRKDD